MKVQQRVRSTVQNGAESVQQEGSRQQKDIPLGPCGNVPIVLGTLVFALATVSRYITPK